MELLAPLLQAGFYLTVILYTIFTAILVYHWENYSMSRAVTIQTYIGYGLATLPLIGIMALIAF